MPHLHRFYIEPGRVAAGASDLLLEGEEAHHALHVVRVKPGDEIEILDGAGGVYTCSVVEAGRKDVRCEVKEIEKRDRSRHELTWSQAWLNQERNIETVIKRGTELGVTTFCFFRGDHSERAPRENAKWKKWAIESCKQCGEPYLPEFMVREDLEAVLEIPADKRLFAVVGGPAVPLKDTLVGAASVNMIVGPEGDFSESETSHAVRCGVQPVRLGNRVLRSEVAGATLAALIQYERGELG